MNLGVEDAVDIGFKLAALVKGYSGPLLLESYTLDRRPVILRTFDRSAEIFQIFRHPGLWAAESQSTRILQRASRFTRRLMTIV
jgi:FAD-dependent monooxygenase